MVIEINKSSPKYMIVYSDIYDKITSDFYGKNEVLPSEPELQKIYGVSRITIRRAMDELQNVGLIEKNPGIGTIVVSNKKILDLKNLSSFSEEHLDESNELVTFEKMLVPLDVQRSLKLKENDQVFKIERIRKEKDKKIGLHCAYVPADIIELSESDFVSEKSSLYEKFHENNIYLTNGYETIEAINASTEVQKLLKVSKNTPILYKERVSYSGELPLEFVRMYYLGDMYKYQIDLEND